MHTDRHADGSGTSSAHLRDRRSLTRGTLLAMAR